jgi:hypothetical protein
MDQIQKNPLSAFMRRPKMFLKLPSGGKYWPEGSLDLPENGELPVYGLTVKDEIMIRTPDALFSGHSTVSVIKSCIPNIIEPWKIPSIDLDAILVAIRIASYGEKMNMSVNIPVVEEDEEFEIDLRPVLDTIIDNTIWEGEIKINNDLTIFIEPVNYKAMTDYNLLSFDSNRVLQFMMQNENLNEDQKVEMAAMAMSKLADATLVQVYNGIKRINSSNGNTSDPEHIREFIENIDKDIFVKISTAYKELNNHNNTRMITIQTPPQYVDRGAPETLTVPFEFDYSNFFV